MIFGDMVNYMLIMALWKRVWRPYWNKGPWSRSKVINLPCIFLKLWLFTKFVSLVEIYCMVIRICTLHCNSLYSGKITPAWAEKKGQTNKVTKEFSLPLVPKGSMEPPLRKPFSRRNFAMKFTPYIYYKKYISGKNIKWYTVSKWRPNIKRFLFCVILILANILKNHFPKWFFFNEIWLKVGEHEKIYITEIT